MSLQVDHVRSQFPSLKGGFVFADSAGGSQCLGSVVSAISDYLLNTNVQLGADYAVGKAVNARVFSDAPKATATLINAASADEVVFVSSSTVAFEHVSRALEANFADDDELIVTSEHEANVGCWMRVAERRKLTVHRWDPRNIDEKNPFAVSLHIDDLLQKINSKTRLIAISACSNILGEFADVAAISKAIRARAKAQGANRLQICIDCVAFAPHRRIDVQAFDVDFLAFSYYKVYGPHTSALYVRLAALSTLSSLAHYFIDPNDRAHYAPASRLQPGGPGYELTYATSAVLPYIQSLAKDQNSSTKDALDSAYAVIAQHEHSLLLPLIAFFEEKYSKGVRIVGLAKADAAVRAPTVSFVVVGSDGRTKRLQSADIVSKVDQIGNIGIRFGHFYAHRLLKHLGLDPDDGVVRISLVHYNTLEEVQSIINALETIL